MRNLLGYLIMFSPAISFYFAETKLHYSLVIANSLFVAAMIMDAVIRNSRGMKV